MATNTTYNCFIRYKATHLWRIYKISSFNNSLTYTEVFLPNNPTIYASNLAVTPNVLAYGLHLAVYEVTMTTDLGNSKYWGYKSKAETYLKITNSKIIVYGLENGNDDVYIGYNQDIELNPLEYSFDLDQLTPMSEVKFEFYCLYYLKGSTSIPASTKSNDLNLGLVKLNATLANAQFCFNSTSS